MLINTTGSVITKSHLITNSGAASTVAIMVACGGTLNSSYCQSLRSDILSTKEFDEVEQRVDHRSQTNRIEIIQGIATSYISIQRTEVF